MNKKVLLVVGMTAGTLAALSVWNYRRLTLKPQSLGPTVYDVGVRKLPVQAGDHTLYGELLLPQGKSGPPAHGDLLCRLWHQLSILQKDGWNVPCYERLCGVLL